RATGRAPGAGFRCGGSHSRAASELERRARGSARRPYALEAALNDALVGLQRLLCHGFDMVGAQVVLGAGRACGVVVAQPGRLTRGPAKRARRPRSRPAPNIARRAVGSAARWKASISRSKPLLKTSRPTPPIRFSGSAPPSLE